jgi:ribosomal protein L29
MNIKELKPLGEAELRERLTELGRQLMKDRAQASQGTALKSPGKIREARRTIARIKMLLHQRAAAPKAAAPAPAKASAAMPAAKGRKEVPATA